MDTKRDATISFRTTQEQKKQIARLAKKEHRAISQFVRLLVEEGLEQRLKGKGKGKNEK